MWSDPTSTGIDACTDGWYAPAIPYRIIKVTVSRTTRLTPPIRTQNARISAAVKKSSMTMTFLLFTRSATMPPTGESRIAGMIAHAVTVPKTADDPVSFKRYSGSANRRAALPNREMICPITTNVKSLENNF